MWYFTYESGKCLEMFMNLGSALTSVAP